MTSGQQAKKPRTKLPRGNRGSEPGGGPAEVCGKNYLKGMNATPLTRNTHSNFRVYANAYACRRGGIHSVAADTFL